VIELSGGRGVSQDGTSGREQWNLQYLLMVFLMSSQLVFFRGHGIGGGVLKEKESYNPRIIVKFNGKAYANAETFLQYIEEQLMPVLGNQPALLTIDLFAAHKTQAVLDTFQANHITVSLIPGGCTGLVQPLDLSINPPFKDILNRLRYGAPFPRSGDKIT